MVINIVKNILQTLICIINMSWIPYKILVYLFYMTGDLVEGQSPKSYTYYSRNYIIPWTNGCITRIMLRLLNDVWNALHQIQHTNFQGVAHVYIRIPEIQWGPKAQIILTQSNKGIRHIGILLFRWYAGGASWLHHNKRETQRNATRRTRIFLPYSDLPITSLIYIYINCHPICKHKRWQLILW